MHSNRAQLVMKLFDGTWMRRKEAAPASDPTLVRVALTNCEHKVSFSKRSFAHSFIYIYLYIYIATCTRGLSIQFRGRAALIEDWPMKRSSESKYMNVLGLSSRRQVEAAIGARLWRDLALMSGDHWPSHA